MRKILYLISLFYITCVPAQNKKGIGLTESDGYGKKQLEDLNVSWYYNWGASSDIKTDIKFIPLCFSLKTIKKLKKSDTILGFNEPDNKKQSNISVADASLNWSQILDKTTRIGSPAIAKNCLKNDNWLDLFLQSNPKIDFITVHWYKGCDANRFISDITNIIKKYNLPVWVTEFAPQTTRQSKENPTKYTIAEVKNFIKKTIAWMEKEPKVEKYAWHNSKYGTSALYTPQQKLTEIGISYRDSK